MFSSNLQISYGLKLQSAYCRDFQPRTTMLQRFNSKNTYGSAEVEVADVKDKSTWLYFEKKKSMLYSCFFNFNCNKCLSKVCTICSIFCLFWTFSEKSHCFYGVSFEVARLLAPASGHPAARWAHYVTTLLADASWCEAQTADIP